MNTLQDFLMNIFKEISKQNLESAENFILLISLLTSIALMKTTVG